MIKNIKDLIIELNILLNDGISYRYDNIEISCTNSSLYVYLNGEHIITYSNSIIRIANKANTIKYFKSLSSESLMINTNMMDDIMFIGNKKVSNEFSDLILLTDEEIFLYNILNDVKTLEIDALEVYFFNISKLGTILELTNHARNNKDLFKINIK